MEEVKKLLLQEWNLADQYRGVEHWENFNQLYEAREKRLELMASQVVFIQGCGSMGSGVILDNKGNIATNAHVISTGRGLCKQLLVRTVWGYQGQARFVVGEYEQDIAIIRVVPDDKFVGAEIAPQVFLGQDVYAIGHPLGKRNTVTRGIISYPERRVEGRPYVQTDTSINPGNSGGGLFDELGRLVGLPTWKEVWADNRRRVPVANIGFAVPGYVVAEYYKRALQRTVELICAGDPHAPMKPVIIS
jgi:S1-C subfamily serine protease